MVAPWKRVCYITNMAADRPTGARFTPAYVDPMLCTHVVLGYAAIQSNILRQTGYSDDGR